MSGIRDRHTLAVITGRELRAVIANRRIILSIVVFLIVWGIIGAPRFLSFTPGVGIAETGIFYMTTVLSLYVSLLLSSQAFISEKKDGRIETLLCTPVSLQTFWLGKVLGVTIPGYGGAILIGVILFIGAGVIHGAPVLPSRPLAVYLLLVEPLVLIAFTGLLGCIQLYFGIRENRIVNLVILLLIFMLLGAAGILVGEEGVFSWEGTAIMFLGSIALMVIDVYVTRFLRKEKIITSSE